MCGNFRVRIGKEKEEEVDRKSREQSKGGYMICDVLVVSLIVTLTHWVIHATLAYHG